MTLTQNSLLQELLLRGFHALYVCFMRISVGDMSGSRPNTKAQKTWSVMQI